jgi:NAD(P)-dependent dehydrogenase (short-subunit alcohol dehydrogenase family)
VRATAVTSTLPITAQIKRPIPTGVQPEASSPSATSDLTKEQRDNWRGRDFDAVIHNAGVLNGPDVLAVNTVAPFVLTAIMRKPRRLIYLSSSMHRSGSTTLRGLAPETARATYEDSKLCITALAAAVANRWADTVSHAVDPGWVPTRMGGPGATDDLDAGHATQVWLATGEDIDPHTGGYWYHRHPQRPHPATKDAAFQTELITTLEAHTGIMLD